MSSDAPPASGSADQGPAVPAGETGCGDDGTLRAKPAGRFASPASMVFRLLRSRSVRLLFIAAAIALLVVALVHEGPTLRREFRDLSPPVILAAFTAGLAGLTCSMIVWRCLLRDLGSALSFGDAWRVFLSVNWENTFLAASGP